MGDILIWNLKFYSNNFRPTVPTEIAFVGNNGFNVYNGGTQNDMIWIKFYQHVILVSYVSEASVLCRRSRRTDGVINFIKN